MSTGLYSGYPGLSGTSGLAYTAGLWGGAPGFADGAYGPAFIFGSTLAYWYDDQDLTTMFADYVGTPATVGSAVALQLDKSARGVLGSDIKGTGTPALTGAATAATYDTVTGVGTANRPDASNYSWIDFTGDTVGRPYFVDIENTGAANLSVRDNLTTIYQVTAGQRKKVFVPALVTGLRIYPDTNGTSISFTVHSVKEVLGTPRYQTTAAQRPILGRHPKGGRRNLLIHTEDISNAAWTKTDTTITANAIAAPDGTITADLLTEGSAGTAQIGQSAPTSAGVVHSFSIYLKRGNTDWLRVQAVNGSDFYRLWVNVNTGAIGASGAGGVGVLSATSITALPDGWYRVTLTGTIPAVNTSVFVNTASANNSGTRVTGGTYYLWGTQLESGSVETAYQAVTTQYDCTETGVPDCYYLQADGSDDGMVTPALDLSATDKIGVFTAVRKLAETTAVIVEQTTSADAVAGGWNITNIVGSTNYRVASRGTTTTVTTLVPGSHPAPDTSILAGLGDISAPSLIGRANGVASSPVTTSQGGGNYANAALYFFRRGGSSLPFNGLEYGSFACVGLPSADQIAAADAYQNNIVGAY